MSNFRRKLFACNSQQQSVDIADFLDEVWAVGYLKGTKKGPMNIAEAEDLTGEYSVPDRAYACIVKMLRTQQGSVPSQKRSKAVSMRHPRRSSKSHLSYCLENVSLITSRALYQSPFLVCSNLQPADVAGHHYGSTTDRLGNIPYLTS